MVIPVEEQMNTYGGAIKYAVFGVIGALISFIAGIVDGTIILKTQMTGSPVF